MSLSGVIVDPVNTSRQEIEQEEKADSYDESAVAQDNDGT